MLRICWHPFPNVFFPDRNDERVALLMCFGGVVNEEIRKLPNLNQEVAKEVLRSMFWTWYISTRVSFLAALVKIYKSGISAFD